MRILIDERKEYRRLMNSIIWNELCITPELPPKGFADGERDFAKNHSKYKWLWTTEIEGMDKK